MSDEQGRRREPDDSGPGPDETGPGARGIQPDEGPRSGDDATTAHPGPPGDTTAITPTPSDGDATRQMPAAADHDATTELPADGDATTRMPAATDGDVTTEMPAATDGDATRQMPAAADGDATAKLPAAADGDATAVLPGTGADRDATAVLPGTPGGGAGWGAAWAGQAGVRPPRPSAAIGDTREQWAVPAERKPRGRWWMPVLVGIVVVALLTLLGWGVYMILQAVNRDETPAPVATTSAPTPASTPPSTAPSTPPSTAPSTTATPGTPATTEPTGPTSVTIPALKGLSLQDAIQALDRTGLAYRVRFVRSDAPAGTVIDSDPVEGQQVPSDTTVTLIVASPPSPSAAPSSTPTGTSGQPGKD
ncbi:PASTA domain-containing protein [Krasilnikovia sp. MM14-A1259]|uniref:PASTA domain-containing protein n=1 Tax=Krasilnikovia sp. MM14-A1259 TaxID=3373539 RepID=UPI003826ADEB